MRRITIDEVRSACEKTGYRLKQGINFDRYNKLACPLGVIWIAEDCSGWDSDFLAWTKLDQDYRNGIGNGFDERDPVYYGDEDEDIEYRTGYADGIAIRAALLTT